MPEKQESAWLLDSGATRAITGDISDFVEWHEWEELGLAHTRG